MTDGFDAAELLDVEMDQFTRALALVAHRCWFWVERRQPPHPEATQHLADGRSRHADRLLGEMAVDVLELNLALARLR